MSEQSSNPPANPKTARSTAFITDPAKQAVLLGSALIGIIIFFFKISRTIPADNWGITALYFVVFVGIILLAFIRSISMTIRYPIYLGLIIIVGTIDIYLGGLESDGVFFLFLFTVLTALFYRSRVGLFTAAIPFGVMIFIGFAMSGKLISPNPAYTFSLSDSPINWIFIAVVLLFGVIASYSGIYQYIPKLTESFFLQQNKTEALFNENKALIQSINDANINLQRKTSELAIASQIARSIAQQQDPLQLIDTTLNTIRAQFGFYHAGLFLVDSNREFAVLKAATGDAGREMINQNHKLRIGEQGIVGFVADQGVARIAADVGLDSVHFQNPLLPDTHSEMALPLRLGERIIGVLDVQSENPSVFSQQDVNIIQTIADQLAISIDHARVVTDLQRNLEEYKSKAQAITQSEWANFLLGLRTSKSLRYSSQGIQKSSSESTIAREAITSGQTQIKTRKGKTGKTATIAVPLKLREAVIGVIELRIDDPSEIPDFQSLIESIASRLVLSLENARLIEEMQIRVEQERMVSDITSKVRSSTAVNDILRDTAIELGKSLGLSDVRVQLRTKSSLESTSATQEKQS
jgi:GAF domain-containing protein